MRRVILLCVLVSYVLADCSGGFHDPTTMRHTERRSTPTPVPPPLLCADPRTSVPRGS